MKPTLKFCAAVGVCIVVVVGYAFLPEALELFGDRELKQVQIQRYDDPHDYARKTDIDSVMSDSAATPPIRRKAEVNAEEETEEETEEEEREVAEVDTVGQTILFFGDSMVGLLSNRLSDYAHHNGHTLISVTWVSSTLRKWANTDTLDHYLNRYRPSYVFVCLGSNEYLARDLRPVRKRVTAIMEKLHDLPAVWIGPPMWSEDYGFNDTLKEILGEDVYFKSSDLTFERQKDGRHPTMKSGGEWMDAVVGWMRAGKSSHPIIMDKPEKKNRNYKLIVIPATGKSS